MIFNVVVTVILTSLLVLALVRGSIARKLLDDAERDLTEAQARLERGEKILLDLNAENRDLLERLKRS